MNSFSGLGFDQWYVLQFFLVLYVFLYRNPYSDKRLFNETQDTSARLSSFSNGGNRHGSLNSAASNGCSSSGYSSLCDNLARSYADSNELPNRFAMSAFQPRDYNHVTANSKLDSNMVFNRLLSSSGAVNERFKSEYVKHFYFKYI